MASALVTGGAGFVGRYLTKRLLDSNWTVTVVDSLVSGTGGLSPDKGWPFYNPYDYTNFNFIEIDCRDYFKTSNNLEFDYVFHLAAIVGGRLTIEDKPLAVASDLSIDSDMWNWATKTKGMKVINFSSSAAYPVDLQCETDKILKLSEDMIDLKGSIGMPDLTYGWSKLTSEFLGKVAWEKYGIKSVVYRPFSGYGPDQDLTYPFPSICKRALENIGSKTFEVWGSGLQSRDFIHIEDCITGVLQTMDKIDNGEALNLSTGIPTTFLEFATITTSILGYKPRISGNETKPSGVFSRVGDTKKQNQFGFKAQKTIKQGIKDCVEYMEDLKK